MKTSTRKTAEAKVQKAGAVLQDGRVVWHADAGPGPNSKIVAYIEGHEIGEGLIEKVDRGLRGEIALKDAPLLAGDPAFNLSIADETGKQLAFISFANRAAFIAAFGAIPIEARVIAFSGKRLEFSLELSALRGLPRTFDVLINGRAAGQALSEPYRSAVDTSGLRPGQQRLVLENVDGLRDGALVDLVDAATGATCFSEPLTWLMLAGGLVGSQARLLSAQRGISDELARIKPRIAAVLDVGREQLLLQRIDLYHNLLNDRLDREFRAMRRELGLDELTMPADTALANRSSLTPSQFDGIGLYEVEQEDGREWRWCGPVATFLFRDLSTDVHGVRINIATVQSGVSLDEMEVSVNGLMIHPRLGTSQDHRQYLEVPVPARAKRSDKSLIVDVKSPRGVSPPGDARVLAFACSGVEMLFA